MLEATCIFLLHIKQTGLEYTFWHDINMWIENQKTIFAHEMKRLSLHIVFLIQL